MQLPSGNAPYGHTLGVGAYFPQVPSGLCIVPNGQAGFGDSHNPEGRKNVPGGHGLGLGDGLGVGLGRGVGLAQLPSGVNIVPNGQGVRVVDITGLSQSPLGVLIVPTGHDGTGTLGVSHIPERVKMVPGGQANPVVVTGRGVVGTEGW